MSVWVLFIDSAFMTLVLFSFIILFNIWQSLKIFTTFWQKPACIDAINFKLEEFFGAFKVYSKLKCKYFGTLCGTFLSEEGATRFAEIFEPKF